MNALLTIFVYYMIILLIAFVVMYKYENVCVFDAESKKISAWQCISFSMLFVFFNYFCTNLSGKINQWDGDRGNYYYSYLNNRENSLGLDFLFDCFRSLNFEMLDFFYFTTFVCCVILFWIYRESKLTTPIAILFILSTDYVFYTFSALKQCYANIFSYLVFFFLLKNDNRKSLVFAFLFAILASLFHVSGYILFPIILMFVFTRSRGNSLKVYIISCILIGVLAFLPQILTSMAWVFGGAFPYLAAKLQFYFLEDYNEVHDNSIFSFVKGFPFYCVTVLGFVRRNRLLNLIQNYDMLLLLSLMGSFLYVCSIQSYWMFRFIAVFYFPIGVLLGLILRNERDLLDKFSIFLLIFGSETLIRLRHIILTYQNFGGY